MESCIRKIQVRYNALIDKINDKLETFQCLITSGEQLMCEVHV